MTFSLIGSASCSFCPLFLCLSQGNCSQVAFGNVCSQAHSSLCAEPAEMEIGTSLAPISSRSQDVLVLGLHPLLTLGILVQCLTCMAVHSSPACSLFIPATEPTVVVSDWHISLAALVQVGNAAAALGFAGLGCHVWGSWGWRLFRESQVSTGWLIDAFISLQMVQGVLEAQVRLNAAWVTGPEPSPKTRLSLLTHREHGSLGRSPQHSSVS